MNWARISTGKNNHEEQEGLAVDEGGTEKERRLT